jgi:O-acetyl-ADP-ribose deacetylase (regulator of RNase III)
MIEIILGDIVTQSTDAIVNSANSSMLPGSGLSGAIHLAAGRHLEIECIQVGPCPAGEARITAGFKLKAKYVIHAVAPQYWDGTRGEADVLRKTYRSIFKLAASNRIRSISIPAIGTGIYRFPLEAATRIAMEEAFQFVESMDIRFVCFNDEQRTIYQSASSNHQLTQPVDHLVGSGRYP